MAKMVRQGDVLFVPIDKIPAGATLEKDRRVVAEGEATGHYHKLVGEAEVYSLESMLFTKVAGDVLVVHEEHAPIAVEEGLYEIRIQREYTPDEVRRVLD